MLQTATQAPVNDALPTTPDTGVTAAGTAPGDQLGTQGSAVTVQNVPATAQANRLGFTDRDTLPPVRVASHVSNRFLDMHKLLH